MMLADMARTKPTHNEGDKGKGKIVHRELKTKEDIKNYVKGLI